MRIGNTYYVGARFVIKCPSDSFADRNRVYRVDERSSGVECSLLNLIKSAPARARAHGMPATPECRNLLSKFL
jgi:hypothetical protein